MVIALCISLFIAIGYLHLFTDDLDVIQDKFKVEIYRTGIALVIIRGTLFLIRDLFQLW